MRRGSLFRLAPAAVCAIGGSCRSGSTTPNGRSSYVDPTMTSQRHQYYCQLVGNVSSSPTPTARTGLFRSTPVALAPAVTYRCKNCAKDFRLLAAMNHHIKTKHAGQASYMELHDGIPAEGGEAVGGGAAGGVRGKAAPVPEAAPAPVAPAPKPRPAPVATPVAAPTAPTTFKCVICAKLFRAESALNAHYQLKHSGGPQKPAAAAPAAAPIVEAAAPEAVAEEEQPAPSERVEVEATSEPLPTPTPAAATSPQKRPENAAPKKAATSGEAKPAATPTLSDAASKMQEPIEPQPPQFHIDVAPNAPEENEVAAHSFCVNQMTVVGTVSDISTGFVFEEPCAQFSVTTEFEASSSASTTEAERDQHTVRCFGADMVQRVQSMIAAEELVDGCQALVTGRLRLVPQYTQATAKYYHYPVLYVNSGSSHLAVLEEPSEETLASVSASGGKR